MERIKTYMLQNIFDHTQTYLLALCGLASIHLIDVSAIGEVIKNLAQIGVAAVTIYQIVKTNKDKRRKK